MNEWKWSEQPWWKRLIAIVLVPLVLPPAAIIVLAILLPLALIQGSLLCFYWVRLKLFDVPMPPKGVPDAPH